MTPSLWSDYRDDGLIEAAPRRVSPQPRAPEAPHRTHRTWLVRALEQGTEREVATYEVSLEAGMDPRKPWTYAHARLVALLTRKRSWPTDSKVIIRIEEKP